MTEQQRRQLSLELYRALESASTIRPLTERFPEITVEDAYHIARGFVSLRAEKHGEKIIGKKIGVTSKTVQDLLGVHQPDFGVLTSGMQFPNGAEIRMEGLLIQPRAEAEIAFHLNADIDGPGITEADVLAATGYITPCFEIVDSRIDDWKIRIQDTIADNASCGVFVIGDEKIDPRSLSLPDARIVLRKNGRLVSEGRGAAVQGNPLTSVAWLANTLAEFGEGFKAGEIVLSGSVVPLEPIQPGDNLSMEFDGHGSAAVKFV